MDYHTENLACFYKNRIAIILTKFYRLSYNDTVIISALFCLFLAFRFLYLCTDFSLLLFSFCLLKSRENVLSVRALVDCNDCKCPSLSII